MPAPDILANIITSYEEDTLFLQKRNDGEKRKKLIAEARAFYAKCEKILDEFEEMLATRTWPDSTLENKEKKVLYIKTCRKLVDDARARLPQE